MSEENAPIDNGQVASAAPASEGQATWYDKAPDEVKGYIQNKGWDDPLKAVNSYQELEKFRGASEDQLLKLPKDMNEDGALDHVYKKLGWTGNAEDYKAELPEGMQLDQNRMEAAKAVANQLKLTPSQFDALVKFDAEYYGNALNAMNEQNAAMQEREYEELRKEWGNAADEREELARRGLKKMLPDGDREAMAAAIEEAIGTAATLKLFANVGDKVGREDAIHDSNGDRPFGYTREQAMADKKALMDEMAGDKQRLAVYNTGKGSDFTKMQKLLKIIAG